MQEPNSMEGKRALTLCADMMSDIELEDWISATGLRKFWKLLFTDKAVCVNLMSHIHLLTKFVNKIITKGHNQYLHNDKNPEWNGVLQKPHPKALGPLGPLSTEYQEDPQLLEVPLLLHSLVQLLELSYCFAVIVQSLAV